ncbi:MAG: hypothetical protein Q7R85_03345 [bacterium]|nr:hypothetical protein [bacterium]
MKSFFIAVAWIVGIPLTIVLIFAAFGYAAIRFDFWPPTCNMIPIPQARQVCEFSKLDKAPKGKSAEITFWVTVPSNTPAGSNVLLAIEGKDPVAMEKINGLSFQTTVDATTGDTLKYAYLRGGANASSDQKEWRVKSFKKNVYDYVSGWSDIGTPAALASLLGPAVEMYDTWSINYNMQFFEDTRKNLDVTMERISAMGGKEIGVYSFIDMEGDRESFTVQEAPLMPRTIWGQVKHKSGRDASITESEMKQIAKTAKKYGLKTTIYYNIGADYTKYINITANPFAARGSGGNLAERRAGEDFGRYEPKTKAWLDRYFGQLETVLVEWARRMELAGIDAFDITPHYRPPTVAPLEEYANAKWREIIAAMREVYNGKIYADGSPAYRDDVDGVYVSAGITVRPSATIGEMRDAWKRELQTLEAKFAGYRKSVIVMAAVSSFDGALSGKSGMEFLDYEEVKAAGYKRDWQGQADAYEAFFEALAEGFDFDGFGTRLLSWDDMMGPEYIPSRYSDLGSSIRSKPAEAVWKKWVLAK